MYVLDCFLAGPQPAADVTAVRRSPRKPRQANAGSASVLPTASQANQAKQLQAKTAASGGLQSTDETAKGGPLLSHASGGEADADAAVAPSATAAPMASAAEQQPTGSEWNVMEVGLCV